MQLIKMAATVQDEQHYHRMMGFVEHLISEGFSVDAKHVSGFMTIRADQENDFSDVIASPDSDSDSDYCDNCEGDARGDCLVCEAAC